MLKRLLPHSFWNTSELKSGEVYNSIDELPLFNFIKVITTEDFKWLIKSGVHKNLDKVWEGIFSQYAEAIGNGTPPRILTVAIQITYLENRLTQIYQIISYLQYRRSELLIGILKSDYGFKLSFTDLQKDIQRVLTLCKSDEVKLTKFTEEYKKTSSKKTDDLTESDFTANLVSLSKYLGYLPNKRLITISEYVQMIKEFNKSNTPTNGR